MRSSSSSRGEHDGPTRRVGVGRVDVGGGDVGYLLGQSLVERFVVLGLDPLLRRVDHLVTVVVAHLVRVELFGGLKGIVVELVSGHVAMLPDAPRG